MYVLRLLLDTLYTMYKGMGEMRMISSLFAAFLDLPICLSTTCPFLKPVFTSYSILFLTWYLSHNVASNTNTQDGPMAVHPSPYRVSNFLAMVSVLPISAVSNTMIYTTFMW